MEILVKLNNKKKIFILLVYNFTKNMTHLLYKIIFIYNRPWAGFFVVCQWTKSLLPWQLRQRILSCCDKSHRRKQDEKLNGCRKRFDFARRSLPCSQEIQSLSIFP